MNSEMILWRNMMSHSPRAHRPRRPKAALRHVWQRVIALVDLRVPQHIGGGPA